VVETRCDSVNLRDAASGGGAAVPRRNAWLKSDAFQNAILKSATLSVMATDENGIIRWFNVGAERMLGYSAVDVVNRVAVVDFHDPQELMQRARAVSLELSATIAADFEAVTCKASRGVEDSYRSTLIHESRERVAVAMSVTALRDDIGGIIGYVLSATETAARKQPGFEPFEPYEAATPAQRANSSKSDLVTRMSHEMRTPLSSILGFAQLMDSGAPSPTISQKRSIDRILQAGWYLEKLINMARDLALIESGALSLSLQPVPLAAVMRDCQAMIAAQAQLRGVRVTFPSFEATWIVSADRIRLREVLGNLLFAAIESSEMDAEVVMNCESGSEWIRFGINAGGDEISAKRLSGHFRPSDGPEQEASAVDGMGLGLLLARRLVELMGGTFGEERNSGGGKAFLFDLRRTLVPVLETLDVDFGPSTANAIKG